MKNDHSKQVSVHTSRTIMFAELDKVMAYAWDTGNFEEALSQNVVGKKTGSGIEKTTNYLKRLYSFDRNYAPFAALFYFWKEADASEKPLLALVYAVLRDTYLAESRDALAAVSTGDRVTIESLEAQIESIHPGRFSAATRRSMAQNIASSWKQAGFIEGKIKNIRVQPSVTGRVACFAFFLAYLNGRRGEYIWTAISVKALCLPESALRDLAMDCARRDWMEYQYAGSVTSISFRKLMTKTGIHVEDRPTAAGL